ncbi:hypothetical protein BMETH_1485_0 [methanotrophic bacterial endosymbiont of Bathymodiolus sp.]|nr:hypothetical protein BMETH_1485_0 [methanotrophic bacterial endosymbiont of Bathymodiolus sp.]
MGYLDRQVLKVRDQKQVAPVLLKLQIQHHRIRHHLSHLLEVMKSQ